MIIKKQIYLILLLILVTSTCLAKKNEAAKAKAKNLAAVTLFVDINKFNRKDGAASKMTKLHQQFAEHGYTLIKVNVYTENGDLEGFFVSYVRQ
ncbi:MAG: hypothetical protein L3J52_09180 [Proteobacteria bacterium]|nr:hypothetical protein [Pseudomonadota bacterium]